MSVKAQTEEKEPIEGEAVVIESDDTGDDAAFDSGFEGTELPTETPEGQHKETPDDDKLKGEGQAEPSPEPEYVQLTKADYEKLMNNVTGTQELQATLGKQFDTAFGKIGGIERFIKELQDQTPLGEAVEITDEDFEELTDEYGDVMTSAQIAGLKRVFSKLKGTGGGNAGALDEGRVQELIAPSLNQVSNIAVERAKSEIADETLSETHPDWRDVVGVPDENGNKPDTEYRRWLATQPQDYQDRIDRTYSPIVIGNSIDKFKKEQEALKKKAASERRDRFDSAVTPRGDGGHPPNPDEDDGFDEGFKSD